MVGLLLASQSLITIIIIWRVKGNSPPFHSVIKKTFQKCTLQSSLNDERCGLHQRTSTVTVYV